MFPYVEREREREMDGHLRHKVKQEANNKSQLTLYTGQKKEKLSSILKAQL
jgi:dsDNA-binding SOS-regulon protein